MAHQIVATSVPRGLDGVSGYQTVLKSKGIPPRLFDRLKARAGYSHPYSHGDPRNPVVYVHRIEELAGSRWHVLGCIRDAGSDHTGRSNFLAHMLGIEAGEARSKPGGPAAAAMAGGCFLTKWDGPPDGTALPKTLVAADWPPLAGDLPAWKSAGLDPGLAGDLAAAAMGNKKVVLVTRPTDDVLALFADALRLVDPSKRWVVTFNTCAVEDFDGTWKAVRSDLVDAKQLRTGKATVIDLSAGERGSEEPYAQFARGDTSSLPWQKQSRAAAAPREGIPKPSQGESTVLSKGGPDPGGAGDATRKPKPGDSSRDRQRVRRPRYAEEDVPSRVSWQYITIAALVLVIGGASAAFLFREQLFGSTTPARPRVSALDREMAAELDLPTVVRPPAPGEATTPTVPQQGGDIALKHEASKRLAEKRSEVSQQLENGTYSTVRTQVRALDAKVAELKGNYASEWEALVVNDEKHQDPGPAIENLLEAIKALAKALSDVTTFQASSDADSISIEDINRKEAVLTAANEKLAGAAEGLDALRMRVRELEEELCRQQTQNRQQKAFAEFQTLSKAVSLPAAWKPAADFVSSAGKVGESKEIDLGPFRFEHLIDPTVRLAVPCDLDEGDRIELVKLDDKTSDRWEIQYLKGAVGVGTGDSAQPPRVLASLYVRESRLVMEPATLEQTLSSLLRRTLILVGATSPSMQEPQVSTQTIRLVEPRRLRPIGIRLLSQGTEVVKLPTPPGVSRAIKDPARSIDLPIDGMRIKLQLLRKTALQSDYLIFTLNKAEQKPEERGVVQIQKELVAPGTESDLAVLVTVKLSLQDAAVSLRTQLNGDCVRLFGANDDERKAVVEERLEDLERGLRVARKAFEQIANRNPQFTPPGDVFEKKLRSWFTTRLMVAVRSGMQLPGHSTVGESFSEFLGDPANTTRVRNLTEFGEALSAKGATEQDFAAKFESANQVYTTAVSEWKKWFWALYEPRWMGVYRELEGAIGEGFELRVVSIVSLALDASGEEYEVPLVVLDEAAAPVDGPASSGGGTPVGLD